MKPLTILALIGLLLLAACDDAGEIEEALGQAQTPAEEVAQTTDEDAQEVAPAPDNEAVVEESVPSESEAMDEADADPVEEVVVVEPTATTAPTATSVPTEAPPATTAYNAPAWTTLPLTNARTGETFTLADFAGQVVYVEPMATWCPNCRAQQRVVNGVIPQLDSDQYVFISLSVEPGLADSSLASYADQNGFQQLFVVATPDLTRALVDQFGRGVTTPPSTPHFTIAPDGAVSGLSTGSHSANSIVAEVTALAS